MVSVLMSGGLSGVLATNIPNSSEAMTAFIRLSFPAFFLPPQNECPVCTGPRVRKASHPTLSQISREREEPASLHLLQSTPAVPFTCQSGFTRLD